MKKEDLAGKDHTLLFGPYRPPACQVGDWLDDAHYGRVQVGGFTTAPTSWPRPRRKGPPAPILTDELVRAIQKESAYAVAYWWNVSIAQVQNWRRWLGVGRTTEGSARLLSNSAREQSPAIRQGIAQARRGKPVPEYLRGPALDAAKQPKGKEWAKRARQWMVAGQERAKARRASAGDTAGE